MKTETKIQFVDDWRNEEGVSPTDTVTDELLDGMWNFAERNQNLYPGIKDYCHNFNESFLATIARRAKMRSLLEVRVAPVKDAGAVPGAGETKIVTVPRYIGIGTRSTGAQMVPMLDEEGGLTDEGRGLMLAQALKQMQGHLNRYEEFLPPATLKKLGGYMNALKRDADKAAVRRAAA